MSSGILCDCRRKKKRLFMMKKNKSRTKTKTSGQISDRAADDKNVAQGAQMLTACARISNERYQAFVENIEEGVYEVDIHGNFLYFNHSLSRIFGRSRAEIQFQNFSKFMDEGYAKQAFKAFNDVYESEKAATDLVWRIITKKGDVRVIECSANLITNQDGEKIGFRGIARDITDRFRTQEALRASERRYRTLLDFMPYPIVVYTLDGRVSYLNPAFTETFGWTLTEIEGRKIPNVPAGLEQENTDIIRRLLSDRVIMRQETKRLTKDGKALDVVFRAAIYSEIGDTPSGELVIFRDITQEKRIARNNEALLRIGMALPEYPDLDRLLDYISGEVKRLLNVEGALVILLDESRNELFFKAAAHDDSMAEKRVKEVRYPSSKGVSGKVLRTGKPIIVQDTRQDPDFYSQVDVQAGFETRSMLDVPLRSKEKIIGVLCAINKKEDFFNDADVELLNLIAGTVALSIENAQYSEKLKAAYEEVKSLNRAKDKVINHLSHELKTPLSVLSASLNILTKKLESVPNEQWQATIDRARRNLERILEMQYEVEDIMRAEHYETHYLLSRLLEECADELEALVAEESGEGPLIERIRKRIDALFTPVESPPVDVTLDDFVKDTLGQIAHRYSHRQVTVNAKFKTVPLISIPVDPLRKMVIGLVKNAIENTPDGGRVEVMVRPKAKGAELVVRDYGVGITPENQRRIFEGFFSTQETMDYSSKQPFDFNAGGKGADLLRMKIFSERYKFNIGMKSTRCRHVAQDGPACPGDVNKCPVNRGKEDCEKTGGTVFTVYFPAKSRHRAQT
jgi:PAS domain S-box-containing protein